MPVQALTQQVCSSASTIYLPGQLTRGDFWIIQTGSPPISFVWMEDPVLHTFVALTEVVQKLKTCGDSSYLWRSKHKRCDLVALALSSSSLHSLLSEDQ